MENKSADEIVKSSIKTGGFPSDILEYLVELETEKLRLSQDKGDLNYADLLERLKSLENDVKVLKNESTSIVPEVEEKNRTISLESNPSKASGSSMFGPSRKWFDYSTQRTNSKDKEPATIPQSNSSEALPSAQTSNTNSNSTNKKNLDNKQNLIQPMYTLPNALMSYDTKSRGGNKETLGNSGNSGNFTNSTDNNKSSWASQMSMSMVLGGNSNNKDRKIDMRNITEKLSLNIPKDLYGSSRLNNRSMTINDHSQIHSHSKNNIYGQQQIIKNHSQLNNRRRSATDVSLSKQSTHSNHSAAYPDSRYHQNQHSQQHSPMSSQPSATHTPSKSSISRGDRASLDTDTVCSEIIPEGNENILEFCIVEADWSALVKDDVLIMSSLLPSREQFRYPVPEDNQADTNTQLIQSQNFFFPSGVQVDFVTPSAVPLYTKKCNYKRHIVPFMDTQGTPTYACCLTVTQAYSYDEIQQIDSKIVSNLVQINHMKQAVLCIQKAYRQYIVRLKDKMLSTLTNATHTHGGMTSGSSFSDSFSKVWSKSVTGLISSTPVNKAAPTVQQSAHISQQQSTHVTQTSVHSVSALTAAAQQSQSTATTNTTGHSATSNNTATGGTTTTTHSTQSAGFFSKLFRGASTTSEESDPNHNSGQSVSSLNAAVVGNTTAAVTTTSTVATTATITTTVTTTATTTTVTATTTTTTEVSEQPVPHHSAAQQQSVAHTQAPATPVKDTSASNSAANTKAVTPIVTTKTSTSSMFFGRSKAAVVEQPPVAPSTTTATAATTAPATIITTTTASSTAGATSAAATAAASTAASTASSVAYSFYKSLPGLSVTHSPLKTAPVVQSAQPSQPEQTYVAPGVHVTTESAEVVVATNDGDKSAELELVPEITAVSDGVTDASVATATNASAHQTASDTTISTGIPDAPLTPPLSPPLSPQLSQPMSPLSRTSPILSGTGGSVVPEVNKEMLLYLLMMSQLETSELNNLHALIMSHKVAEKRNSINVHNVVVSVADAATAANSDTAIATTVTATPDNVNDTTNTTDDDSPATAIKAHLITLLNSNTLSSTDIDEILSAITEQIEDCADGADEKDNNECDISNSPMSMDSNRSSFSGKSSSRNSINRNSIAEMTAQFAAELAAQKAAAAAQAAELVAKLEERRRLNELEHIFRTNRVVVAQKAYCIITSVAEYTFIFKVLDAIAEAETNLLGDHNTHNNSNNSNIDRCAACEKPSKPQLSVSDVTQNNSITKHENTNSNNNSNSLTLNITPLVHSKRETNRLNFLDSVQSYMLDYYCGNINNYSNNNCNGNNNNNHMLISNSHSSDLGCAYEHDNSTLTTTVTHNNNSNTNINTTNKNTKNKNNSVTQVEVANQFLNKYVFNTTATADKSGSLAQIDKHSKQGTPNSNWTTPAQQISSPSKGSLSRKYSKKVLTKSNSSNSGSISPLNNTNSLNNKTFASADSYDHHVIPLTTTNESIESEIVTETTETTAMVGSEAVIDVKYNTKQHQQLQQYQQQYQINVPEYIDSFVIDRASLLTTKEWSCAVLFAHLNADVVFKIINLLLMETSLIIYGKNPGIVTTITLAVINLINPFVWEGIFVPLIPDNARELFGAPVPFILGTISPPRIADVAAATAILYLNDDIVLQSVPPPPPVVSQQTNNNNSNNNNSNNSNSINNNSTGSEASTAKPVKPSKPPKPVKSDSSLSKTAITGTSETVTEQTTAQPALTAQHATATGTATGTATTANNTPNTTPVKPAKPAKLNKTTKTETETGLQETAAAAVAELTELSTTEAITPATATPTVLTTNIDDITTTTTVTAVAAVECVVTETATTAVKKEEPIKSEFLAWFVRLPEVADMPIDEEILRRIEYVRQQLCAFYIPKLEFSDTKSNKNGLFAPKVDFSLPDIAETVTDATENTINTVHVRNNMDSLLMCDVPPNILKQVQVLISAIERSNFNFCGREIKNATNWRKFMKYSHTSGEEEFCPDYFIEPLRMNLKFQEAMVNTQLFVAYMDTVKREQETLDFVRMFIAQWIYKRTEIKKMQKPRSKTLQDTTADQPLQTNSAQ